MRDLSGCNNRLLGPISKFLIIPKILLRCKRSGRGFRLRGSCPRVKAFVILLQLRAGYVRVYLCSRNIRVPEHLLNRANIGIVLHKMCCERMSQSVRRNALESAFVRVFRDRNIDRLPVDR